MDDGKILLVNLAKARIGEDVAALLGAMLVSRMGLAALSRTDVPEENRRDFYVYLDEFQSFTTLSLANILSELRKYRVGLILAHQYLSQLDPQVRDAILGNVGTMIAFRLGLSDAEILENEFRPEVTAVDLISPPNYHVHVKLMIDRVGSRLYILRYDERGQVVPAEQASNSDELLARPSIEIITVDPETIRRAEARIESCEQCHPDDAEISFDWVLADVTGKHGKFDFLLTETARCPNCRRPISEKTLVELRV